MKNRLKLAVLDFLYVGKSVARSRDELQSQICFKSELKSSSEMQLLVDVSMIIKGDVRTGIQRVVRAILSELLSNPPEGYKVRPIFANTTQAYHYVSEEFDLAMDHTRLDLRQCKLVNVMPGDVFLALDLATQQLSAHQSQLKRWKRKGVAIHVMVYDLLPVLHPEWFHSRTTRNFYRWLGTLAVVADTAICISNSVKDELVAWLNSKYTISTSKLPIKMVSMGCDLESTVPSFGLPKDAALVLERIADVPSALMLGTLEPRKGHQKVLNAFDRLWEQGHSYQLIIVGKPGWKTQQLQKQLNTHPDRGQKLLWLENVSDEYLNQIYQNVYGLIVASEGEGFGLPLIEAAKHGKPILVRDLPVFRELNVTDKYFTDDHELSLSRVINEWFEESSSQIKHVKPRRTLLWRESVQELLSHIICNRDKNIDSINYAEGVYK